MLTDGNVQIQKVVASWGGDKGKNLPGFSPVDCWALRRGRIYVTKTGELQCNHAPEPGMHMCVPMTAQGKTLGLIHLYNPTEAGSEAERALDKQLALTVTEQGVLALANVRLRGILEQQSVRDPLTGLFNRRQLEIQLAIDLENARTQQRPLSILFADIDHFKKFNDRFGHSAGDVMLKTVGHYLEKRTAKKGIVARFGGEEFVIVLQADAQKAEEFATDLIQGVKTMDVQYGGQSLGCITLSVGIASYPSHADRHELLMKLADQALYQAKEDGRDRVVVAPA